MMNWNQKKCILELNSNQINPGAPEQVRNLTPNKTRLAIKKFGAPRRSAPDFKWRYQIQARGQKGGGGGWGGGRGGSMSPT